MISSKGSSKRLILGKNQAHTFTLQKYQECVTSLFLQTIHKLLLSFQILQNSTIP